jgi:hypothetical protein
LGQVQTDVEIVLFLAIGFLKEVHDFPACFLNFLSGSNHENLLVLLLNVVKGMIDFLKRGLPTNPELSHGCFPAQTGHVVDDSLNLVGIEIKTLNL